MTVPFTGFVPKRLFRYGFRLTTAFSFTGFAPQRLSVYEFHLATVIPFTGSLCNGYPIHGFALQRLSRSRVSYPSGFSVCGSRICGGGFPFCGFPVARVHLYTRVRRACRFCRFRLDGRIFFRLHKRAELVQYICFCEDVHGDGGDGAVGGETH